MPKDIPQPVPEAQENQRKKEDEERNRTVEPLSGSKTVKNRNHSRQNHGEGS